jgi:hypothetical protein
MATRSLKPLAHVLVEPIFDDYWTPKAGQAFDSMEQEYHRIRYPEMVVKGQVRMVRRRMGGGYFTILTPPAGATRTKRVAFRSRYVHVAVGYPGLKFLPDLMDYRETYRDFGSVVNAYEPHEQIYERLHRAPGTVLVRGGGIVASRVLQAADRRPRRARALHADPARVPHLRRPARTARTRGCAGRRRRLGLPGLQLPEVGVGRPAQGPHAQAGGPGPGRALRGVRRHQHPEAPGLAGPDAPRRQEGWYRAFQGEIATMEPGPHGTVQVQLKTATGPARAQVMGVIDCTGSGGRHPRAPGARRPASTTAGRAATPAAPRRGAHVRGARHPQRAGPPVRLGHGHAGRLLPRRRHLPRLQIAAQEIADDLAPRASARRSARAVGEPVVEVGLRRKDLTRPCSPR